MIDNRRERLEGHAPLVECGWIIMHDISGVEKSALLNARDRSLEMLHDLLPDYRWKMPVLEFDGPAPSDREFAVDLMKEGTRQREQRHWDYALVITPADLCAYVKPYSMAMPSRSLSAAVLSLARIGFSPSGRRYKPSPGVNSNGNNNLYEAQREYLTDRIVALVMHLLGDLNDLYHSEEIENFMYRPRKAADLDRMQTLDPARLDQFSRELRQTADIRLEEMLPRQQRGWLIFSGRALWLGREEIGRSVLQATPWQFPLRFSGLSTASISTLIVLLASAEGWDLGTSMSPRAVVSLSLVALALTCTYIIIRQGLIIHRSPGRNRPTEQAVFSNAAAIMIVLLGMMTTWLMLFFLALLLALTLYPEALVQTWAATVTGPLRLKHYLTLAGFTAGTGVVIGALGSSFEDQRYFQHIAFVDEEL